MKTAIAATLMAENQNSNSPYDPTENRFVAVSRIISTSASAHCGAAGIQPCTILAPAVASTASTTAQNHQYNQPIVNPAQRPIARSAYAENDPVSGDAADISPSMRITSTTRSPAIPYETRIAGPVALMPAPEPTKRPAPITP